MPFPQDRLQFKCEVAFDINPNGISFIDPPKWTDVSAFFLDQQVTINRGRANEQETTQVAGMTFQLDNIDGRFTPDNAMSPLYPNVRRGKIMRFSINGGERHLQVKKSTVDTIPICSTPDNAAIDIVGDIEIELDFQPYAFVGGTSNPTYLIGKYNPSGNQRSWAIYAEANPNDPTVYRFALEWSPNGTSASAKVARTEYMFAYPNRTFLKVNLDVNNGAGGWTVNWYVADPSILVNLDYRLVSQQSEAGVTSIFNSTAALTVAGNELTNTLNFIGKFYGAKIKNSIGGTTVAWPRFNQQTVGTTGFTDAAGRVWSITGANAEISDYSERFFGTIDSWVVEWPYGDSTSTVQAPECRVTCQANSIRRRLGQGDKPIRSALFRQISKELTAVPLAYWPMEDTEGSKQFASGIPNKPNASFSGMDLAAMDTLAGSAALPTLQTLASFRGPVDTYVSPNPNQFTVSMLTYWATEATIQQPLMRIALRSGAIRGITFSIDSTTQYRITALDANGEVISTGLGNHFDDYVGKWGYWLFSAGQSGADVIISLMYFACDRWADFPTGLSPNFSGQITIAGATLGNIREVYSEFGSQMAGVGIGHITILPLFQADSYQVASLGFNNELSIDRFLRLCDEEGIACSYGTGPQIGGTRLGPQKQDTLLNLLEDIAFSSNSIFLDARNYRGLQLVPLYDMFNQFPVLFLDAAAEAIANPLSPTLDDQTFVNAVESTRDGGSSKYLSDDVSIALEGEYLIQATVNVANDNQLGDDAGWRLAIGSLDEVKIPPITIDFAKYPNGVFTWLSSNMDVGKVIRLHNLPRQTSPYYQYFMIQGYSETISPTKWTATINATPADVYNVAWFDDPLVTTRLDAKNSLLALPVNSTDTTLKVYPDVDADNVPQAYWSNKDGSFSVMIGGEYMSVTGVRPTNIFENSFTTLNDYQAANGVLSYSTVRSKSGVGSALLTVSAGTAAAWMRVIDALRGTVVPGKTYYGRAYVYTLTSRVVNFSLDWIDAGGASLSTSFAAFTTKANEWTPLSLTAVAPANAVSAQLRPTMNTPTVTGEQMWVDELFFSGAQTFTVVRSGNGIVKSQVAGTKVNLLTPVRLGMGE